MEKEPARTDDRSSRRDILRKTGRFAIPTLVTYHMTALKVRASGTLNMPLGRPF